MKTLDTKDIKAFVFENRPSMGEKAAHDIIDRIKKLLNEKDEIRMVFAAAPSQNEVLASLVAAKDVDWSRVVAFHMDEYIGLEKKAPQLFSNFLNEKLFNHLPFKQVHLINGANVTDECERYSTILNEAPIDIVCLGIGENGHLAFNDPPVADFNDTEMVKEVTLDEVCRQQQVNDGCFQTIEDVPSHAYTLTIPALLNGNYLYCVVPGKSKQQAVFQTLNHPEISTEWPSTILRNHDRCNFYFDIESYGHEEYHKLQG